MISNPYPRTRFAGFHYEGKTTGFFQQPFSWKALGVDIRGRSSTLRINYRTSHQIRTHADRLLSPNLADVDGNTEQRNATISLFNGPVPEIAVLESQDAEIQAVAGWIEARVAGR